MKNRILLIVSALFSMVTVLACDDGGGSSKKDMTPDEFMDYLNDQYVQNFCDYALRCPEAGGDGQFQNAAQCRSFMEQFFMAVFGEEMMWAMENGAEPNPSKLDECMNTLKNAECDVNLDTIPACRQIFTGTIATGEPCSVNWQCASGYCNNDESCPGVCAETKAAGSDCSSIEECNAGLVCNEEGKCSQPSAPAAQGDPCEFDNDCAYGLYCLINDFENYTGTCQPWLAENDTCENDQNEMVCGPGLGCDSETGTCKPVTTVGEGQACDDTHVCDFSQRLVCAQDSCIKLPSNGEACFYGDCWMGNYCGDDDICHTSKATGEACTTDEECTTELCNPQSHVCEYDPCDTNMDTGK